MASTHKSLRSGTANKRPTTSIADGQIALNTNTTSPGLFFKDSTGATIIKVGPVHVGTTAPNASPAAGGSAGNSVGEIWLDTSLTPVGVKIWNGSAFVNATPIGSTTVQGLLELATNAETQTGTDPDRAVTPAGLQSKVSDSTSTTSSTTIASSTAVKSAYDLANAALPKSGGTVTGNLEIGTTGSLSFEGATADAFETTIAVVDPTADRTITLPDTTGTIVTTGDTGTVTSTMIADGTIVDADISATAEIAVSKLADGTARQLLQTDAAGTGVEWASNIDVPGTLDVTSTATFDSIASHPLGSAAAPTITFTGDTNTGIYSPGADQVAISTGGSGRLFVASDGKIGIGSSGSGTQSARTFIEGSGACPLEIDATAASGGYLTLSNSGAAKAFFGFGSNIGTASVNDVAIRSQSGALAFQTNGANERLRITSTGALNFVGAGTAGVTQAVSFNGSAPVNSLVIDSSGRLGVGTSSPAALLHVLDSSSTTTTPLILRNYAASVNTKVRIALQGQTASNQGANAFIQSLSGTDAGGSNSNNDSGLQFIVTNGGGATENQAMTINTQGRVGIGSTSPQGILEVKKGGASTTPNLVLTSGGAGDPSSVDPSIQFSASGAESIGTTKILSTGSYGLRALAFHTGSDGAGTERARIDSSGRLLVGTSSTSSNTTLLLQGYSGTTGPGIARLCTTTATPINGEDLGYVIFGDSAHSSGAWINAARDGGTWSGTSKPSRLVFSTTADGASSPTERMRINSSAQVIVVDGSTFIVGNNPDVFGNSGNAGRGFGGGGSGILNVATNTTVCAYVNRMGDDGSLISLRQAGTEEGTISVSGTTVSYNGAHLSRWSQLPSGVERTEILRGTVLSNIDEMCEWGEEENEQLNRMKISDIEGDKNVSGVFQAWDDDDDTYTNDFYCAMTGDFIIRIAADVTVERGDLLMSAGDGTAKPQDDDIIRSKTIAKVTSTNVSCTYDDDSYCVPCVLMAC